MINCKECKFDLCEPRDIRQKVDCFIWYLSQNELGLINVPNGTEGEALIKTIYELIKPYTQKETLKKWKQKKIPKKK